MYVQFELVSLQGLMGVVDPSFRVPEFHVTL